MRKVVVCGLTVAVCVVGDVGGGDKHGELTVVFQ